jgi:hypothetical protein
MFTSVQCRSNVCARLRLRAVRSASIAVARMHLLVCIRSDAALLSLCGQLSVLFVHTC